MSPVDENIVREIPAARLKQREDGMNEKEIPSKRGVFVVHGRNVLATEALETFLRSIDLRPIDFLRALRVTGSASPYIGNAIEKGFDIAQAVVVLLTGDDLARLRADYLRDNDEDFERRLTPQARPNVIFEAGRAFGSHPMRTVLVQIGDVRPFSDIAGRHVVFMNNTAERRVELGQKLMTAGCAVDISGTAWLSAGDFEGCINKQYDGDCNTYEMGILSNLMDNPNMTIEELAERMAYAMDIIGHIQTMYDRGLVTGQRTSDGEFRYELTPAGRSFLGL